MQSRRRTSPSPIRRSRRRAGSSELSYQKLFQPTFLRLIARTACLENRQQDLLEVVELVLSQLRTYELHFELEQTTLSRNTREQLKALVGPAKRVAKAIANLNHDSRMAILRGCPEIDLEALSGTLEALAEIAPSAATVHNARRGRPKVEAYARLMVGLVDIFYDYARLPSEKTDDEKIYAIASCVKWVFATAGLKHPKLGRKRLAAEKGRLYKAAATRFYERFTEEKESTVSWPEDAVRVIDPDDGQLVSAKIRARLSETINQIFSGH